MLSIKSVMSSPTRIRNYDVDEFCDKLLSSDKFEKLIEKVADKAVERISEIRNDQHYDSSERVKKSHRAVKTTHTRYNEKDKEIESSKVNKMTNLGSYSIAPLSDLSLQFKKFTKKVTMPTTDKPKEASETLPKSKESREMTNTKDLKDISIGSDKESKEGKDKRQYSEEEDYHHAERTDNKTNKKKITFKEIEKHTTENEKKEIYKEEISSGEFKSDSDESIEATTKQLEKNELKRVSIVHVNSTTKDDEFHKEHDKLSKEKKYSKENVVSKSTEKGTVKESKKEEPKVKNEQKEKHSEEHSHEVTEKHPDEENNDTKKDSTHISEEELQKPQKRSRDDYREERYSDKHKPILRSENGRVYTYQISSEYDDYHEQLLQSKNSKRKSAW
ncbi:cylicin-2-like isoform X2 [Plodia interpunctella]|nr:cylicin-2-like isoform X2 [Plodia interpunctella]